MPFNFFEQPDDGILESLQFLNPQELETKRLVHSRLNTLALSNQLWNAFLKEPFQIHDTKTPGKARDRYIKHPQCRVPQFATIDAHGRQWFARHMKLEIKQCMEKKGPPNPVSLGVPRLHSSRMNLQFAAPLIQANLLALDKARQLSEVERSKLQATKELILANVMNVAEAMAMDIEPVAGINIQSTAALIIKRQLTIEEAMQLDNELALKLDKVSSLMISGHISFEEVQGFSEADCWKLQAATDLIQSDKLTVEAATSLPLTERQSLALKDMVGLIKLNVLSLEEVFKFSDNERHRVCRLQVLIMSADLSLEEAKQLTHDECFNLANLIPLVQSGHISTSVAKKLSTQECDNLKVMTPFIQAGEIECGKAQNLNIPDELKDSIVLLAPLLMSNLLEIEDLSGLNEFQVNNLHALATLTARQGIVLGSKDVYLAINAPFVEETYTEESTSSEKTHPMAYRHKATCESPA